MRLLFVQFSLLLLAASAFASGAKAVEARIESMPEDGTAWILKVDPDAVPAAAEKRTHFWLRKAPVDAKAFHAGDLVVAVHRARRDARRPAGGVGQGEMELAGGDSQGVAQDTVKEFDGKHLTVGFADGTEMPYRATEKTKITLDGKPATLGDPKPGQGRWLKGRRLPTLDVFLVAASDSAILEAPKKGSAKKGGRQADSQGAEAPRHGQDRG